MTCQKNLICGKYNLNRQYELVVSFSLQISCLKIESECSKSVNTHKQSYCLN